MRRYSFRIIEGDIGNCSLAPKLDPLLMADLGILEYLKDVSPVADANMFIIYGAENGYDVSELSVKDLTELSATYTNQIRAYLCNKVRTKISNLVARWHSLINRFKLGLSMPEPLYRQFVSAATNINTIKYRFSNINTEAVIAPILGMRADFVAKASNFNYALDERIPVDPELVDKFFKFFFDYKQSNIANRLSDSSQYGPINRELIQLATVYLCVVGVGIIATKQFAMYDDPDGIYQFLIKDRCYDVPRESQVYIRKCRALELCHVLALDTTWIDGLILPSQPIIRDNAAAKLAGLLMVSGSANELINAAVKDENEGPAVPMSIPWR